MAEIGLVKFATLALQAGQAVLPAYRSKFSKHQFAQPQLLAILCLMRYEDWTFRANQLRNFIGFYHHGLPRSGMAFSSRFPGSPSFLVRASRLS
jgi:hypothetical protein